MEKRVVYYRARSEVFVMKTAFTLFLISVTVHAAAQQPSLTEILQQARTHYERTQQLSAAVELSAEGSQDYELVLVWKRDGDHFRTEGTMFVVVGLAAIGVTVTSLFDGKESWIYTEINDDSDGQKEAHVFSDQRKSHTPNGQWQAGLRLDGVLYGDTEDVFTILLRQVDQGHAIMRPVSLDNRTFVHVTGSAPEGQYELWLDPAADYRLTKSIVRKSGTNPLYDEPIQASSRWASLEATVTDVKFETLPEGPVAVSGTMKITGTPSPLSSTFPSPNGDIYTFTRTNCRFGIPLTKTDLTLAIPDGVGVIRND